jgi:hypothetical protein
MAETDIPNWLNSSFFETALRSGGYGQNVTVTSSEIGRATSEGDNYVCDIWRAKLQVTQDGRQSTLSLIVKAQPTKEGMAKVNILFCLMLPASVVYWLACWPLVPEFAGSNRWIFLV